MVEKKSVKSGKEAGSTLTISLVKGTARIKPTHSATVRSLGLTKIGQSVTQPDNPAIRGMIRRVDYLIKVENA